MLPGRPEREHAGQRVQRAGRPARRAAPAAASTSASGTVRSARRARRARQTRSGRPTTSSRGEQLVDGEPGQLAEREPDRAERPRPATSRGYASQSDRAGRLASRTYSALRRSRRWRRRVAGVDRAAALRGGLDVVDDGVRRDRDAVAGQVGPPAEVDVVAEQRQLRVEPAEALPHVAADEHAGAADGEHRPDVVVLALVLLARLEPGLAAAGPGDRHADLEQLAAVGEVAHLRADDADPVVLGRRAASSASSASGAGTQSSWSTQSQRVPALGRCAGRRRRRVAADARRRRRRRRRTPVRRSMRDDLGGAAARRRARPRCRRGSRCRRPRSGPARGSGRRGRRRARSAQRAPLCATTTATTNGRAALDASAPGAVRPASVDSPGVGRSAVGGRRSTARPTAAVGESLMQARGGWRPDDSGGRQRSRALSRVIDHRPVA